jgi:hypothetical protein
MPLLFYDVLSFGTFSFLLQSQVFLSSVGFTVNHAMNRLVARSDKLRLITDR